MCMWRSALLAFALCGSAACDSDRSPQETLIGATRIETDRIGDSAQTSRYYVALTNIIGSPTAVSDLSTVFKRSKGPAGKLYALYGLSTLDDAKFEALSKRVNPGEMVDVMNYCIIDSTPAKEVLREISSGQMQQKLPVKMTGN
jgi:hypothetical protein